LTTETNDLGAYIGAEVSRSEQDFQATRSRALSLIGVSGGLVALVSGLLAIAVGNSTQDVTGSAQVILAIALFAFVLSAVCGLIINFPAKVVFSDTGSLRQLVASNWGDDGWDQQVAVRLVEYLDSLRRNNNRNAIWLIISIGFQILGIATIAVAAILILSHAGASQCSQPIHQQFGLFNACALHGHPFHSPRPVR
jgi:MFS family permease